MLRPDIPEALEAGPQYAELIHGWEIVGAPMVTHLDRAEVWNIREGGMAGGDFGLVPGATDDPARRVCAVEIHVAEEIGEARNSAGIRRSQR